MRTTVICIVTLLALGASAEQQGEPLTREEWQARIAAHQAMIGRGARVFLDRSRPVAERIGALRGIEEFVAPEDVAAAAELFLDRTQPAELRANALAMIEHAVDRNPAVVTEVLRLATSRETAAPLRAIAVKVLTDLSFSSLTMQERSAEMLPALRTIAQDPDPELRRTALSILAAHADDFAQQRLIECVRNPAAGPLPRVECIRLLGFRLHGDAYPVLHQVALSDADEAARIEAVRLLGGYSEARPALIGFLDSRHSEDLRMAALGTLYANDPAGFPALAIAVVRDERASDALRLYAIQAVRQRRTAILRASGADMPSFDAAVAEVARTSKSDAVRRAAADYVRQVGR